MRIIRASSGEAVEAAAAAEASRLIAEFAPRPTLILLSGGSALRWLERVLVPEDARALTLAVLDERVSEEPGASNFARARESGFFARALRARASFFEMAMDGARGAEGLEPLARRMDAFLKGWVRENRGGRILATQGIGEDGHTAGIMPLPEDPARFAALFDDRQTWAVGYDAAEKNRYPLRVTATLSFLRAAVDASVIALIGPEKAAALRAVAADEGTLAKTPARIVREMKDAALFTDIAL